MSEERTRREADWLAYPEALERILSAVEPLPAERVPVLDARGRTLAEPVDSPVNQPPWDNSAMDGFAVRAGDIRGASAEAPVTLDVVGEVRAGQLPERSVGPGQAIKIMTGAPVPDGADSVVRVEHTDAWEGGGGAADRVVIVRDEDAGRNIRKRGEDLAAGHRVLEPGHLLRHAELGVLAAAGRSHVLVHRRPRVAILSTGDELADVDAYHEVRAGRKIVDSNAYALAGAVRGAGAEPMLLGIARDEPGSLRRHLEAALDADVLLTSAGASVGEHDRVKDVLDAMGFTLDFWRVKIRPGSPFSLGRLGRMPVFGLPGNPVSALVTFLVLVRPALRRLQGRAAVHNPTLRVRAAEPMRTRADLTYFLRVRLERGDRGEWNARLTGPQGSGILTSVARADALLVVPESVDTVEAGQTATAIPLFGPDPAEGRLEFSPAT